MKTLFVMAALLLSALTAPAAFAGSDPIYTSWRNNNAVGGYDVTTFFDGVPLKGKAEHFVIYKDARWKFATQTNRDKFIETPDAFVPAYGGYCAWAVANDKLAKGNPKYWTVEDGRLYLNFNRRIKARWEKDKAGFIRQANGIWPEILED